MGVVINIDDSAPVFAQLVGQIKKAVLTDEDMPGGCLAFGSTACERPGPQQQDGGESLPRARA